MIRSLKIFLLVLVLFPALLLIINSQSSKNTFDWLASGAYEFLTPTPPACNPAEICLSFNNGCSGPPPAVGTGYNIGGTHCKVQGSANCKTYCIPVEDDDKGGGSSLIPPIPPNPPIPTPTLIPPGTGTINVWMVYSNDTGLLDSCADLETLKSTGQYLIGAMVWINAWGPYTQTDETGVTATDVPPGEYAVSGTSPSTSYTSFTTCGKTTGSPTYTMTSSAYVVGGMTADFLIGFGPTNPWFQINGGGSTYGDQILSLMPLSVSPWILFDTTSAPTSPGILSTLTGMNLSDSLIGGGLENISSTNWNTNNAMTAKNWFTFFTNRLNQAVLHTYEGTGGKPDRVVGAPYTVYTTAPSPIHDLTINTPWVVADGERLIVIVDGTLDIRSTITIQGNGFIAFVVKNDIMINAQVGTTWDSTTPLVEGMYIAGGTFKTGTSTDPATERFVGKGTFAATTILLQRNLSSSDHNKDTSADLFFYNPSYLILMPDILKDLSYTWEEVAP